MATVSCTVCGGDIEAGASACIFCGSVAPMGAPPPARPHGEGRGRPAPGRDPFARPDGGATTSGGAVARGRRGAAGGYRLRITSADGRHRTVSVGVSTHLTIGSATGPAVDLCTSNISRVHAEFRIVDGVLSVSDVGSDGRGSTNGTFVNGVRLTPGHARPVEHGDVVACGADPALTIVVEVGA